MNDIVSRKEDSRRGGGRSLWLSRTSHFCSDASVVGLRYVANPAASPFRRSVWLLLLIVGAAFTTFQIQNRVTCYISHSYLLGRNVKREQNFEARTEIRIVASTPAETEIPASRPTPNVRSRDRVQILETARSRVTPLLTPRPRPKCQRSDQRLDHAFGGLETELNRLVSRLRLRWRPEPRDQDQDIDRHFNLETSRSRFRTASITITATKLPNTAKNKFPTSVFRSLMRGFYQDWLPVSDSVLAVTEIHQRTASVTFCLARWASTCGFNTSNGWGFRL